MEGVVISAKKGIVTVSVVSNAKGEFSFPAAKLGPGAYALSIKATGYDLTGPSSVTLAGAPRQRRPQARQDQEHRGAADQSRVDPQRSRAPSEQKNSAVSAASTATRSSASSTPSTTPRRWLDVIRRMATYSNNSFHLKPQVRKEARDLERFVPGTDKVAAYFASINRSTGELDVGARSRCRASRAPAPAWSSPNTTCPIRPSSRTT